ncbi:hypothetical protein EGW08_018184 [Elysia chlorotica]|uniref:Serine/threonine-protein kinase Nek2 n=1 Tax=Elysia chlorotica TaxID=188477 RepID=A0A3S0ZSB4_ELYCH|nr:hypothetical protein EGW08_018184 [Elysia chlorotica]
MPEMDMPDIGQLNVKLTLKDSAQSKMGEYHYDINDNLRNNRPGAIRPICTYNLDKPPENTEQTIKTKDEQSPVVSLKTPRMPSTLEDFEVIGTIGTGSYGTCKKIRRKKDGKVMVWKEMEYGSMTESEKQMLVSEVNLLRELRHQHIVRYYDRIIDRTQAIIYIIMEYCQGGDLASIISRNRKDGTHVSEDFAWKILIQATLALKECHRRKNGKAVLHRDLKPANVFLDADANVKLGDFGLARVLQHEHSLAQTYVGTPYYMSPELVNNQSYNEKSDIWSLGCMLYELCALTPPFTATNEGDLKRKIRIGQFPRLPTQYSLELDMIIRRMIQVEVSMRPSIDSILADSVVQRKQDSLNRKNSNVPKSKETRHSGGRLSGSSEKEAPVSVSGQETVVAKMRQLALKEKELESRERSLAIKEKLAEDKLKRARELLEKCSCGNRYASGEATPRLGGLAPSSEDADSELVTPPSCLLSGKTKDSHSPKKHVTFHNILNSKENLRGKLGQVFPIDIEPYKSTETSLRNEKSYNFLFRNPGIADLSPYTGREMRTKYTRKDFGLLNFR